MARSERVSESDACSLSRRWLLEPALAVAIVEVEDVATRAFSAEGIRWPGLYILSGHRTEGQQADANPFNPASHHRCCPSLAVDLRVADIAASLTPRGVWQFVADLFEAQGVRWGGDFSDPELQSRELNHFYLSGPKCLLGVGRI